MGRGEGDSGRGVSWRARADDKRHKTRIIRACRPQNALHYAVFLVLCLLSLTAGRCPSAVGA